MAGERLCPRKIKTEVETAILPARHLEHSCRGMGYPVMDGDGHVQLDNRRGITRRICQHCARHRQPQAAHGREKAVLGVANRRLKQREKTVILNNEDMASIFSRIIAGEIPSYKVAEDENYYAFLDINPLTKGHTLVVPKMEVDYIFDLDDKTLAGMMLFAKRVAAKIKQEIACKRVAVVVLGLEVPHAHIHLIPIQSENDVDFHREKLKLTPEEFREIAAKLFG